MKRSVRAYMPLLLLFALCLFMALGLKRAEHRAATQSPMVGREFPLLELAGGSYNLSAQHRVMLVNVFSSWCLPCAAEQPELAALAQKNLLPVIGIAWKSKTEDMQNFLKKYGNPYTQVIDDPNGEATVPLGLTGVPETFIISSSGRIQYHTKQPLTPELVQAEILPAIEKMKGEE